MTIDPFSGTASLGVALSQRFHDGDRAPAAVSRIDTRRRPWCETGDVVWPARLATSRRGALGTDAGRGMITVRSWWSRPEQRLELFPVGLLVDAAEGTSLNRGGTATAGNVPRWLIGGLSLTVGASTLGFDDVEVDQQGNGDEGATTGPVPLRMCPGIDSCPAVHLG